MGSVCSNPDSRVVLAVQPTEKAPSQQRRRSTFFRQRLSVDTTNVYSKDTSQSRFFGLENPVFQTASMAITLSASIVLLPKLIDTSVMNIAIAALTLKKIGRCSQNVMILLEPTIDWGKLKLKKSPNIPPLMSFPSTTVYAVLSEESPMEATVTLTGTLDGKEVVYSSSITNERHKVKVPDSEVLAGAIRALQEQLEEEAKQKKAMIQQEDGVISSLRMDAHSPRDSDEDTDYDETIPRRLLLLRRASRLSRSQRQKRSNSIHTPDEMASSRLMPSRSNVSKSRKARKGSCSSSIYGHLLRMDESDSTIHRMNKNASWSSVALSDSSCSHIDVRKAESSQADEYGGSETMAEKSPKTPHGTPGMRFFQPVEAENTYTYVPGSFAVPPGFKRERRPTPIWLPMGIKNSKRRPSFDDVIDEEGAETPKDGSDVTFNRKRRLSHHRRKFLLHGLTDADIARLSCQYTPDTNPGSYSVIPTPGSMSTVDDPNLSSSPTSTVYSFTPLKAVQENPVRCSTQQQEEFSNDTETECYTSDAKGRLVTMKRQRRLSHFRRSLIMKRFTAEDIARLSCIDRNLSGPFCDTLSSPQTSESGTGGLMTSPPKIAQFVYEYSEFNEQRQTTSTVKEQVKKGSLSQKIDISLKDDILPDTGE